VRGQRRKLRGRHHNQSQISRTQDSAQRQRPKQSSAINACGKERNRRKRENKSQKNLGDNFLPISKLSLLGQEIIKFLPQKLAR